jgi:hypothetical protein
MHMNMNMTLMNVFLWMHIIYLKRISYRCGIALRCARKLYYYFMLAITIYYGFIRRR